MSGFPFVFGVEYEVTLNVMFTKYIIGSQTVTSNRFQLEGCPDPTNQAAVVYTSYCAPCPENGICNGTITVIAGHNMYRPSAKYAMFLPCDDSKQSCVTADVKERIGHECMEGYEGFLCSVCSEGYGKSGSVCSQCPDGATQYVIVTLSIVAMFVFYVLMCFT
eukprot:PhF_6_TR38657/c0_g2_i2/m.57764